MNFYGKNSNSTICRHMVKNIGDLVLDERKQNQGKPIKFLDRQKRNNLRQAKVHQEEVGNFTVKRVIARAGITPSISTATVRKVMRKAGFKWSHT